MCLVELWNANKRGTQGGYKGRFYNLPKFENTLAIPLIKRYLNYKSRVLRHEGILPIHTEVVIEDALKVYMRYLK